MRSVPVVSKGFLERIADPKSQFYPDYQHFLRGEMTQAQLITQLPHLAMVGDSVCMDICVSSRWTTFWRAHRRSGSNWFLHNTSLTPGVCSISKRLGEIVPFVATEHAGIGAYVGGESARQSFFRRILGTRNFSGQVMQLVRARRFPDLILISIGHNNVDWAWQCPPGELDAPDEHLRRESTVFRQNYARELRRLLARARTEQRRVAVVVFGLINFESYFKGRALAERARESDKRRFPYLETTYKYFVSFQPAYRRHLIRLASMLNEELCTIVYELNRELADARNIQLRYSNALATADLSRAEFLHPVDGWHASVEGHNVLADAAFKDLLPSLSFLGIQ